MLLKIIISSIISVKILIICHGCVHNVATVSVAKLKIQILFNVPIHFSENLVSHLDNEKKNLDNVSCLMIFAILINRLLDHAVCSDVVRRNKNLIKTFWHGSQF